MTPQTWLTVARWDQYQHYSDRLPPWCKLHTRLKTSRSLNVLHPTARLLFFMLLITAAEHDNVIPLKRAWLAEEVSLPVQAVTRHLPSLIQAGLLVEHASKPEGYIASKLASKGASDGASRSRVGEELEEELEVQKPAGEGRSEITRPARQALKESDNEHEPDEEPFAVGPEPAPLNGTRDGYGPQPLGSDVEELARRWSEETA